ncbi:MAG: MMPL family transporter, partial [Mycobacteriaceae bacterium]|nr:MMPL family transporter [Mycobacteriaceae bacterium]
MAVQTGRARPDTGPALGPLGRWGIHMARRRTSVLVVWIALAAACGIAYLALQNRMGAPDYSVDRSESGRVNTLAAQHFPQLGDEQQVLVFRSGAHRAGDPAFQQAVDRAVAAAGAVSGVRLLAAPSPAAAQLIAPDKHTALAVLAFDGSMSERVARSKQVQAAAVTAPGAPVSVALTGFSALQNDVIDVEKADAERAELIGVPVALLLLTLAFGAVAAAFASIAVALVGIVTTFGTLFLVSLAVPVDSLVGAVVSMIGTGVGIDYAMIVVSRFREELSRAGVADRRDGPGIAGAVGAALDSAGKTVLASGLVVMISLCSLIVIPAVAFRAIAGGIMIAVLCTLAVVTTLLPAALAAAGPAINRGRLRLPR